MFVSASQTPRAGCIRSGLQANCFCHTHLSEGLPEVCGMAQVPRLLPANAELYRQGEEARYYYLLLDGWVGLRVTSSDGALCLPDVALPGDLLGLRPGTANVMAHTAYCLTACSVCVLPRSEFDRLAATRPDLTAMLSTAVNKADERMLGHFINVSSRAARERVAHMMVELFHRARGQLPREIGDNLHVPLTLAEIGQALGLTSVHVSRTLRSLREEDILHFSRERMVVGQPDALLRLAGIRQGAANRDSKEANGMLRESIVA